MVPVEFETTRDTDTVMYTRRRGIHLPIPATGACLVNSDRAKRAQPRTAAVFLVRVEPRGEAERRLVPG